MDPASPDLPGDDAGRPDLATLLRRHLAEPPAVDAARDRASGETAVPGREVGSLLRWAATTTGARTVVEIGSAAGVSGLWLLDGMDERGVLTSIEPDPHVHNLATMAYDDAGLSSHVRAINGSPSEVLDRLTDDGYGLCVIQVADPAAYVPEALRLLTAGGLLVVRGVDAELLAAIDDEERLTAAVLAVDGGLLLASLP